MNAAQVISELAILLAGAICVGGARAEVVFLANYNAGADADFSLASKRAILSGGAALTTAGQGCPFAGEAAGRGLDLGLADPGRAAGVQYEVPIQDLRSGTIELRIKTGYDWFRKYETPEKAEEHSVLVIPLAGGVYNVISVGWYNRFGPWFNLHIYDGKSEALVGVRLENAPKGFDSRPGVWHHVVATWTPQSMRMFVDGKLVDEKTLDRPFVIPAPDAPMRLGAGPTHLHGKSPNAYAMIDGLRIANRAWFAGRKEIPVPKEAPTIREEAEQKTIAAGGPGTALYAAPRRTYPAPRFAVAPRIDGDLADPAWETAPRVTGFVQPTLEHPFVDAQTVVQAGWDDANLYLAVTCMEGAMSKVKAESHGRDPKTTADDALELYLAPWPEKLNEYFLLAANAGDGWHAARGLDSRWEARWSRAVKRHRDRWTLEMAVPFASLGVEPPRQGTLWRWNAARDRQAGGGVEGLSTLAELTGGLRAPDEFDKLLFVDRPGSAPAAEMELNEKYVAATLSACKAKLQEFDKELAFGSRILSRARIADTTADARRDLEARAARLRAALGAAPKGKQKGTVPLSRPELDALHRARLEFRDFDAALAAYVQAANKLGFVSAARPPASLGPGVAQAQGYWYLVSPAMTAAVDPRTGVLCGLRTKTGRAMVGWSYDLYTVETVSETRKTDERLDEVISATPDDRGLTLVCRNPLIPNATLTKRFSLVSLHGQERILAKQVTVAGEAAEKTLLAFVSRTFFDEAFRARAYYHRVKPAGTMGDPRCVFWARQIKEPVLLHFLFNVGAAANLCAVDPQADEGIGQYWLTANGKWVLPCGYEGNKSFFTDTGWDMSWLATFVSKTPQSGQMRYHLFQGDRVAFHGEYRDLPERQAVVGEIPISPAGIRHRYNLNFGPAEGLDNPLDPQSRVRRVLALLYPRLRADEDISHYGAPYNDLWHGDYPTGDAAMLHYEFGTDSKTYPALKVRTGIVEGQKRFPRVLSGWYHTPQNICSYSQMAKEHPEWIMRGKDGRPVPSGWHPDMGVGDFSPPFVDELLKRLVRQMDYFQMQHVYLDFSITGPLVDWGHGVVRYSDASCDFLQRLWREVQRRGGILHLNSITFDGLHDLGYWEGFNKYDSHGQTWRDVADCFLMRRLYDRPGARSIPLYWLGGDRFGKEKNYRDYTNLVLSHLLTPADCWHDPYHVHFKDPASGATDWQANYAHAVAYHDAMLEAGGAVWKEADLEPAWWRDPKTEIEAYVFHKGGCHLVTALWHDAATAKEAGVYLPSPARPAADATLSASTRLLGLSPDRPTFVWQFVPRDPDKFPRRAGIQNLSDWDKLFTSRTCAMLPAGTIRQRMEIKAPCLQRELTRLFVVTQVPAAFCSVDGKETNLLMPEMLACRVAGPERWEAAGYQIRVRAAYPAELLLFWPRGASQVLVNGRQQQHSSLTFGDVGFVRVSVPSGDSEVTVR